MINIQNTHTHTHKQNKIKIQFPHSFGIQNYFLLCLTELPPTQQYLYKERGKEQPDGQTNKFLTFLPKKEETS